MITLGVDHGTAKIGLAISDELGMFAAPLPTLRVKTKKEAYEGVLFIAKDLKAEKIVVGVPSGWQDNDSPQTKKVKKFVKQLQTKTNLMIDTWDESYSTQKAEKGARGRKRANSDSEAARIILQEYLDWDSNKI